MNLPDFIEANLQGIVDDWAAYALVLSQKDSGLTERQLRDAAREILMQIAADMRMTQSAAQQEAKSHGATYDAQRGFDAASSLHADDRLEHGFAISDVVAEFRALRASVLRRWQQTSPGGTKSFQEMIRFNEAIDQALTESIRRYAQRTERIRDLFAGVLAHDLRAPLGAILNSAELLLRDEGLSPMSVRAGSNVQRGAMRMKRMIDDLLIFTRTRLGDALPVSFAMQDMGRICSGAVEEIRALYPDSQIALHCTGELAGMWDRDRITQLLVNLLSNAVRYGAGPISVEAVGDDEQVVLAVSNEGNPIPENALPTLFDPLTRANPLRERGGIAAGMGLGLYICRCIAQAHNGTIQAASTEHGMTFTVRLPRLRPASVQS
ncbi:sensor histidine kinase [Paraburkholderia sp. LEh10]|uniref:sensor histidine kinase n=1 Tax=Paraburkholderia sp. LEh10 TaxID=2821353 RepID=UPI001AE909EA|nr:sensor histidine kinase [Paraburkholderia sp. LEh10]MBP0596049.1 sensor histidine kinase [Paraburkholderia sp. LEh10]